MVRFAGMLLLLAANAWGGLFPAGKGAAGPGAGASGTLGGYPWIPDQGDGTYRNPVILADYSDPDVLRVGEDYYLVASSFNATPALPILRSRDLVNWTIVGHALANLPHPRFTAVEPGGGVWAPAWRVHDHKVFLFFPMPDDGIYVTTAATPEGPWSPPTPLIAGKGLIDPCPFWDDDGRAYLVHAYAKSRSGIKSKLRLVPMAPDASRVLGEGTIIFDGTQRQPTLEGPKLYKRDGWYIVLAPAGGVTRGWQVALRSRDIWGPYQDRVVLQQGATSINGPHQGALVDTPDGRQWWFVHFQDAGVYGRVVHLNPVTWVDDWPLMGVAAAVGMTPDSGIREPVLIHRKPATQPQPSAVPQTSDDFDGPRLSPQWQWNANHDDAWYSLGERPGYLRLYGRPTPDGDLGHAPHLLLQKFPARSFAVETTLELAGGGGGATSAGLIVIGKTHAALAVATIATELNGQPNGQPVVAGNRSRSRLLVTLSIDERPVPLGDLPVGPVRLRVDVAEGGLCRFSFGGATGPLRPASQTFQAQPGNWIGARVGLFAARAEQSDRRIPVGIHAVTHADFAHFRFTSSSSALASPARQEEAPR